MSAQAVRLTEGDIDDALAGEDLEVVFQPVFSFEDGAPLRVEAFVRWAHPVLGTLPPGAFVSFFEAQGRMGDLTRHVLRRAIRAYKAWRGVQGPGFSINLAASDVADDSFPGALTGILAAERIPPSLVMLECPPLTMQDSSGCWDRYRALKSTGCRLAVEVRGRASEALWAADPFPFDEIKTGGPAVLRFARTARGGPGLTAISELLELGKKRGARCVAVGIEDASSAAALKSLGFDGGQGNLLAAAAPLENFNPAAINKVRGGLGLPPLDREQAGALFQRPAAQAPLILTDHAGGEAGPEPSFDGSMAKAIALLKAKKIAAKKEALTKAEAERQLRESEAAAARQASDTARRLQERLEAELGIPPEEAAALGENGVASMDPQEVREAQKALSLSASPAPRPAAPAPEDEEAGLLLSDDLAEVALGVVRRASFADGISTEGYVSNAGAASQGAFAETALTAAQTGAASAIFSILDALPGEDEGMRRVAAERAEATARAPEPEPEAEPEAEEPAALQPPGSADPEEVLPPLDEPLTAMRGPEDELDDAVAAVPVLPDDAGAEEAGYGAFLAVDATEAALAARIRRPRRKQTNLLTRKYRITHFWPRSWVRAARRYKAARAMRVEDSLRAEEV